MPRTPSSISLKITDFSDRELLAIASVIQNADGKIDIQRVAEQIWPRTMKDDDAAWHARHCVAIRFAYMRRMGVIDKYSRNGKPEIGMWELTEFGEEFVRGAVSAAQERAITESKPGQELELMALMGQLFEKVDEDAATLMRREFQFRAYRRRWG
jgi:hypothetical protein